MTAIDPTLEAAYLSGQARPTWPDLLRGFAEASRAALAAPGTLRDIAYGPHPRQVFDILPAAGEPRAVMVYLHAGYWQARDKADFACLAGAFGQLGCITVMANYPLCPDATLEELTEAVRALIPVLRRRFAPLPLFVSGHSAGGHLAVELALTDWSARGLATSPIAGIIGLSGVYDLTPLVATSLNARLRLTEETARAASPVFRAMEAGIPALFAVGGGETPAFLDQTQRMGNAWAAAGGSSQVAVIGDDDHFSLLSGLMAGGPLADAITELLSTGLSGAR